MMLHAEIRKFIDTTGTQDGRCPIRTSRTISPDRCGKILLERLGKRAKGQAAEQQRRGMQRAAARAEVARGDETGDG